jgi:hypothetical protein
VDTEQHSAADYNAAVVTDLSRTTILVGRYKRMPCGRQAPSLPDHVYLLVVVVIPYHNAAISKLELRVAVFAIGVYVVVASTLVCFRKAEIANLFLFLRPDDLYQINESFTGPRVVHELARIACVSCRVHHKLAQNRARESIVVDELQTGCGYEKGYCAFLDQNTHCSVLQKRH